MGEFANTLGERGLALVTVDRFGVEEQLSKKLKEKLELPTPQYVWDALREQKYYVAKCEYVWDYNQVSYQDKVIYHWVKQGPAPPVQVQNFLKDIISEPRTECGAIPTAPPIADVSGTWNMIYIINDKEYPAKLILTQRGNKLSGTFSGYSSEELLIKSSRVNGSDFITNFSNSSVEISGIVIGDTMTGEIIVSGTFRFTATRVK